VPAACGLSAPTTFIWPRSRHQPRLGHPDPKNRKTQIA
jgi:hypothetical protein